MNKIKYLSITTCVVLSSVVIFSSSVLAAPAIVNSDASLKFDNVKLQQVLTAISDKEPNLNIVFYSTNTFSPNTVLLPNGNKVNKAVHANDSFIGSIKKPNYVSLYYNKDDSNSNKGSFSANVGADFRTLISTQDISNNIVKPNIGKYLPQDPEAFIPVVAEQVVVQIKAKQLQIATDIETKRLQVITDANNKQAWDNAVKSVGFGFIIVLLFIIVYYLIKTIIKRLRSNLDEYNKYKLLFEQVNISYTKLVEQSTYLSGYTGATGEKANHFLEGINKINEQYLDLKALPKFINVIFETSKWATYTQNLHNLNIDLKVYLENIETFIKSIEGLSGTDPLAEVIRLQKLEEETKQYNDLLVQANKSYNGGSEYVEQSQVHALFKAVQDATNLVDRQAAAQTYYPIVSKEFMLINKLNSLKQDVKEVANYIINNKNNYYIKPLTNKDKEVAKNLLIRASNHNNYYDLTSLKNISSELDDLAVDYKTQDNQYQIITERRKALFTKLNSTVPDKFAGTKLILLDKITNVKLKGSSFKVAEKELEVLESEINTLLKNVKEYKSRQTILSKYSDTRKETLEKQLEDNNYSSFDVLVFNYTNEDNRNSYSTPSSSYSSRSSSSYYTPSSFLSSNDDSYESSSSDDSSSWSSSSSDDSSSSSSSSDDSW